MFFSKMKDKLTDMTKKLSGRKDFLEAVCASCALIASADGDITDTEIQTAIKVISSNPSISAAYKPGDIEKCADAMLKRAQSGRTGRMGLYKEIDDIASNADMAEMVYLCALDVAESDGNIGNEERDALSKIASRLGVNQAAMNV